jgi:hypothetical protein
MARLSSFCGAAIVAAALTPATALAQSGPCSDDIAALSRELGTQVGLGAPVSEPGYGQRQGPNDPKNQAAADKGGTTGAVGTKETDRSQPGGASRERGGSPGTVGGVAGPVTSATGGSQADGVASGRIATSPEDVRRQSENRPTAAAAAAKGGNATAGAQPSSEDRVSQAKMVLQRAVDLNAKGDRACADAVQEARRLKGQ